MTTVTAHDLPDWLIIVSWLSLTVAVLCTVFIGIDVLRRPQPMTVMALVWPICALFGSAGWLGAYLAWGRAPRPRNTAGHDPAPDGTPHGHAHMAALGLSSRPRTRATSVFTGTSHCGAGCTLADIIVEWAVFAAPAIAVAGGKHWLFTDTMYANWVIAFVLALVLGIGFQYFAVAPMNRQRSRSGNLRAAAKADVLSLTAWQVGMYGAMAVAQLGVFPAWLGGTVGVGTPVFWAIMQIAMLVGFATSFPVNWWLVQAGVKEPM